VQQGDANENSGYLVRRIAGLGNLWLASRRKISFNNILSRWGPRNDRRHARIRLRALMARHAKQGSAPKAEILKTERETWRKGWNFRYSRTVQIGPAVSLFAVEKA
jgi:hypothetical protein